MEAIKFESIVSEKSLRYFIHYYFKHEPAAVEEYCLDHNIKADILIHFLSKVLDNPKDPLLKAVLFMTAEITEIQGLSTDDSAQWIDDALKVCKEEQVLKKVLSKLHNPSLKIKKYTLRAILAFLRSALIIKKRIKQGHAPPFSLGQYVITDIINKKPELNLIRKRHKRSNALTKSINKIFKLIE